MDRPSPASRPAPPREPEPWECCGSGCEPCVYDRYWDAVERYERDLERWLQAQQAQAVNGPQDAPGGGQGSPRVDKAGGSP